MNAKRKNFSIAFFFSVLIAILTLINICFNSGTVTAQNDAVPSSIVIELEHDREQLLVCQECEKPFQVEMASGPLVYALYTPLAVDINSNENVTLLIQTDGSVTSLDPELFNGESAPVSALGNNRYQVTFSHAQVTYGYRANHNHTAYGRMHIYQGATLWGSWNLVANIIDENVPAVSATELAADARVSLHLVNLRLPDIVPGSGGDGSEQAIITNRFYQLFPDDFDFLNIVYAETSIANRYHRAVSNDVHGIGLQIFDSSASYGSSGKLLGINDFPVNTYFDLAEHAAVHELGHQWVNYALADGSPHWPISSMAQGLMGFNIPGSSVGGQFPWDLSPDGDGNYWVSRNVDLVNERGFTDIDLYLMGLLPAGEVRPGFVFQNQDQADQLYHGGLLIIDLHGPRIPSVGSAPTSFRVASIFVTRDRFLTDEEMAFFDYMAARAETTSPLPAQSGFWTGETIPFYLATHRLATLNSKVLNSPTVPQPILDKSSYLPMIRRE